MVENIRKEKSSPSSSTWTFQCTSPRTRPKETRRSVYQHLQNYKLPDPAVERETERNRERKTKRERQRERKRNKEK